MINKFIRLKGEQERIKKLKEVKFTPLGAVITHDRPLKQIKKGFLSGKPQ